MLYFREKIERKKEEKRRQKKKKKKKKDINREMSQRKMKNVYFENLFNPTKLKINKL